jgi:hypothetical protein
MVGHPASVTGVFWKGIGKNCGGGFSRGFFWTAKASRLKPLLQKAQTTFR